MQTQYFKIAKTRSEFTNIPRLTAKWTAIGTPWQRGSWYGGYLLVTPCVRNITGYLFCFNLILKRIINLINKVTEQLILR